MSLFTLPTLNIGKYPMIPSMNPTVGLPSGGSVNLGSYNLNKPTTYNTGISYAPLGDWKTPMGLTNNWGQLNQPITDWYTNPNPYVNTIASVNNTIKNLQPIMPIAPGQMYNMTMPAVTKATPVSKPILPQAPIIPKTNIPITTGKIK